MTRTNINIVPVEVDSITIANWCPSPDGTGRPQQVHVLLDICGLEEVSIAIRFKSRRGLDNFVADLLSHANDVWPEGRT